MSHLKAGIGYWTWILCKRSQCFQLLQPYIWLSPWVLAIVQQMLFTHSDVAFPKSLPVEPLDFFSCFVKGLFMRLILQSFQFLHLCRGCLYLETVLVPRCIDLFSWTMTIILYVDMCVNDLAYKKQDRCINFSSTKIVKDSKIEGLWSDSSVFPCETGKPWNSHPPA